MFRRRQPEAPKETSWERDKQEREERRRTILTAGPLQPCMSLWAYDPQGYCNIKCQTGLPAGQPHEHRALSVGGFRERADWGSGFGNPFEDEDKKRMNEEWIKGA